jgi:ACS family tartrate transporter-like MFS transporter
MSSTLSRDVNPAQVIRKLSRRLLPFLFLLYIVAYLDRINVGFAALQMQGQLGFTDAVYGLGAGMFFAGYFFFQIPSNVVLAHVGARRWIALLLLAWGIISASMMFISGTRSFYTLRFMLGVTEAGFFPGMIFYLRNWFPSAARARTVAIFMTASPMAGVLGGPISGALLNLNHTGGLSGWQWMFLLEAAPAIVLSAVVLSYLTEKPDDARWLTPDERAWLTATLDAEPHQAVSAGSSQWSVLKIGAIWLLTVIYFGMNIAIYGLSFWLPKLIRSQSAISSFQLGLLSAVPYVFSAVAMVLVGLHSDRTGERRLHVAGCALLGVVALVFAAYSTSFVPMFLGVGVAVLAANSMYGPYWAMPTAILPRALAATGIAFINSLGNTGGLFGPYFIGLLKTSSGGFKGGLLVVAGFLTVAAVTSLALSGFLSKPTPVAAMTSGSS